MTDYEKAVEIVDGYMHAMSTADFDAVLAMYAEDATVEDPVGSDPHQGKTAIAEFYRAVNGADITCTRTGPVRYANREIVFPFECVITTPDGTMKIDIIDHFVLDDDDLVVSMRAFWSQDTTSMM